MKKGIFLIMLFLGATIYAQNFQGKATYKTFRKVDFKMGEEKGGPKSDMQKKIQEQLRKQFQQTYTLNFNKSKSTYTQNKKLSAPHTNSGRFKIMTMGSGADVLYKNIATKKYVNKTEISGKRFLIKDELEDFGWKISGETKNIGNYTCYKATKSKEEERTSFSMTDGKQEERKEKVIIETVAWYTPQVPISNGPEGYWGLPGLILEIQEGKQTIVCSEIVLNTSGKIQIKEPLKGKKVTQEKFDEIMSEHSKEMIERFKSKRKNKDGNSFSIQIQG
ncbi:GLPGLI family protein [Tenacibaculum ovolyticum]|uniref:GLPGLI family protein n=1 Tax=Tenacibaculum ovolyticum TaxID=104270 RepID=UPI0022F3CB94|nr:GLPGLI family protein [Tenacibaculum ovolyticum]WBX76058.1 GLPGLI family protein [Tenacibaculum ovolyticum]